MMATLTFHGLNAPTTKLCLKKQYCFNPVLDLMQGFEKKNRTTNHIFTLFLQTMKSVKKGKYLY